jgi:hypothetical protein
VHTNGAGLAQPGKNYRAVRTGEFNWQSSETPSVIASIKGQLKSGVWRSKFVIFHICATFFFEILLLHCVGLAVLEHFHHV